MVSENEMDYNDHEDDDVIEECCSDSDLELEDICPLRDDAKVIYQGHTSGVLCLTLDEQKNLVYTGGLDDKVIIWELNTGRMITVLTGHEDSVTHLSLNRNGSILASGDMSGVVIMWRKVENNEQWERIREFEISTIVGLAWQETSLFACDTVGTVVELTEDINTEIVYKYGQGCSCNKFCLVLNGEYSATLYADSCGEHENCKNTSMLVLRHNSSERTVKESLRLAPVVAAEEDDGQGDEGLGAGWADKAVSKESHLIAIGDYDRLMLVSVAKQGYSVHCSRTVVPLKAGCGLVDNVAFCPTAHALTYVAFSSKGGAIGVYDYVRGFIRYLWRYADTMPAELRGEGDEAVAMVSQLAWSSKRPSFMTAGVDGRLCEWDAKREPRAGEEVPTWWGYSGIVWDMRVTADGSAAIVVSEDKVGRLFAL